jgi:glycosyltransferase involved in cell wall biosynthesis
MNGAWTFTTVVGLLSARLARRGCVLSTHESLTDFDRAKSPVLERLVKRVLRPFYLSTFGAVVMSSALEQRDSGDPDGRRSVVIPHTVRRVAGATRVTTRPPGRPLEVGFLGRLHPKKNLDVVIEALARLDDKVVLRVAGDGPERGRLLQLARDIRVDEQITWVGFVQAHEKTEFLRTIDVLVMPSAYECFGVSAIEALGAGVPVIVSPTTGVADVIRLHGCGFVVDPDVKSVTEALARVSRDRALLKSLGQKATATVEAEFSSERHGKRLHDEYLRLLRRPLAHVNARAVGGVR